MRRARQVVLSGCKGGVGTTTLVINLAIALRRHDARVLVVDANPTRGDVATLLRLNAESDLDDVINGRNALQQVMQSGPNGIQVIPSVGVYDGTVGAKVLQLVRHLDTVAHAFDWILIDAGCCPTTAEMLWSSSEQAIVISTTDYVAITDAYALIKAMTRKQAVSRVATIINRSRHEQQSADVQRRLAESCRRFLRLDVSLLDAIPDCTDIADAANAGRPVVCSHPLSPSAKAIVSVADQLTSVDVATNDLNPLAVT